MSSIQFNHSSTGTGQTIAVNLVTSTGETVNRVVTRTHPNFERLVTYLISEPNPDVDHVHGLVDPTVGIGRMLQEEFGDRITFDLHHFYIDGIPEVSACAKAVKDRVLDGSTDWRRLVRFLVRVQENPSKRAKDAVWEWVEKHGVTIAEDGRMLGFKGLVPGTDAVTGETNVPVSVHRGPNNFIDGQVYGQPGEAYQVPHRLGSVISKRRADVDDSTDKACSTGLHVGAYSYAKTFGENREDGARYSTMGRVAASTPQSTFALVAFAPEDVVSVPGSDSDWKIRVCKYEVVEFLEEVKDVLKDKPIYDVKTPAPSLPADEPFVGEPTVEAHEPDFEDTEVEEEDEILDGDSNEPGDVEYDGVVSEDYDETKEDTRDFVPRSDLVEPTKGTGLLGKIVLRDWAEANDDLARDLASDMGNTAVARKYSDITTESSVRRYRKG